MYNQKVDKEFDAGEAWSRNIEPFKRNPLANEDWYIIPLTIIGTFLAFTAVAGVERVFNVLAQFITSI